LEYADPGDSLDLRYLCESIFSGIDSFQRVVANGRLIGDGARSTFPIEAVSVYTVKERFDQLYTQLLAKDDFGARCYLLVELF
jgi:hypothetical protein